MTNLDDVLDFISGSTTRDDLAVIAQAMRTRQGVLSTRSAGGVDDIVKTRNLSPKALNELTGVVQADPNSRSRTRQAILLDEASTARLRRAHLARLDIPQDAKKFLLTGIPIKFCEKVSDN